MNNITSFSKEVRDKLGHYVYGLIDPRNGKYFYIGKGQGNRVFAHANDALKNDEAESAKLERIKEINNAGLEVGYKIIRHGLNEMEAFIVESALIDCIGIDNLTNKQLGKDSDDYGIASAEDLQIRYACEEFKESTTTPPFVIIKVRQEIVDDRESYYEACRWSWKLDLNKAKTYNLVLCVVNGIVREVFSVSKWQKDTHNKNSDRVEFEGNEAESSVRDLFINKRIPEHYRKKGQASPALYSKSS